MLDGDRFDNETFGGAIAFWSVKSDRFLGCEGDRFLEDVGGRSLFESVEDGDRFWGCRRAIAVLECRERRSLLGMWGMRSLVLEIGAIALK